MSILREYQMPTYSLSEEIRRRNEIKRREKELAQQKKDTFIDLVNKNFSHPVDFSIEKEIYDPKNHISAIGDPDAPKPDKNVSLSGIDIPIRNSNNTLDKFPLKELNAPAYSQYGIPTEDEEAIYREETADPNPDIYPDYRYGYGSSSPVLHPYAVPKNSTQIQRTVLPRRPIDELPELQEPGFDWEAAGTRIGNLASNISKSLNPEANIPNFNYENQTNKEARDSVAATSQINDIANSYRQNRELMETISGMGFNVDNLSDDEIVSLGQQIIPRQLDTKVTSNTGNEYVRAAGGSSSGGGLSPYQEERVEDKFKDKNETLLKSSHLLQKLFDTADQLPRQYFGGIGGGLAYVGGLPKTLYNYVKGITDEKKELSYRFQTYFNDLIGEIRKERFGATLTPGEKESFESLYDGSRLINSRVSLMEWLNKVKYEVNKAIKSNNTRYRKFPFYQNYLRDDLIPQEVLDTTGYSDKKPGKKDNLKTKAGATK